MRRKAGIWYRTRELLKKFSYNIEIIVDRSKDLVYFIYKEDHYETKKEVKEDEIGANLPYEGVGVVGPYLVDIKFDLDSKEARVMNVNKDTRDIKRNYMAGAAAMSKIQKLIKEQKEIVNE